MNKTIALLGEALKKPLPGWDAQRIMMNYDRPKPDDISEIDPDARMGGVLVLLYPKNSRLHVVLTLRNTYDGTHSGQVSLPGGKQESEDTTLWDTAIRETEEEIGLPKESIKKVGQLTQIYIPPSRFLVSPFVGYVNNTPRFVADPMEVKAIIETPFQVFLDEASIYEKPVFVRDYNADIKVKYFDIQGHTVWGATAMILSELAAVFKNQGILESL